MKSRILLVLLAAVLALSLAGLAGCAPTPPEPTPPDEPVWEWPRTLALNSSDPASVAYPLIVGWSTALGEDTGMTIRLMPEDHIPTSFTWLKEGRTEIGFADFGAFTAIGGQGEYATRALGPIQARILFPHGKGGRGFAVRGDSGIETPYDIKPGTRIIFHDFIGPLGRMWPEALLAWAQVDPEDVVWVPAGSIQATSDLLLAGRGDVVMGFPSSPQWLELEASPGGLAWIELDAAKDPAGAARFGAVDPSAAFGLYPAMGVPTAHGVPMIVTIPILIVMADKDP